MQYLKATLDESLQDIFRVGEESFKKFYPREKFLERIKDKKYWIYLAKEKQEVVGFKIFYEDNDRELYSWLSAVKPKHRRKGIASTLMNLEINFAKENNYSKIKLKTHKGHPEMISLCKKFRFIEVGREPHHWKDNIDKEAIFFELNL
ncbi:MAG: GNAT family N-acetyltransferase [archaeon]